METRDKELIYERVVFNHNSYRFTVTHDAKAQKLTLSLLTRDDDHTIRVVDETVSGFEFSLEGPHVGRLWLFFASKSSNTPILDDDAIRAMVEGIIDDNRALNEFLKAGNNDTKDYSMVTANDMSIPSLIQEWDTEERECKHCEEPGVCYECDGSGYVGPDGDTNECSSCDATGTCRHCDGGVVYWIKATLINGKPFNVALDRGESQALFRNQVWPDWFTNAWIKDKFGNTGQRGGSKNG